jgi:hypothetical protein
LKLVLWARSSIPFHPPVFFHFLPPAVACYTATRPNLPSAQQGSALSDKVPGTLGTRNGNEEHGTSVKATWNVEGYTADRRSFDEWNVFPTI